jgi:4-hydroxy-2-oxoheptanedioate aldolase
MKFPSNPFKASLRDGRPTTGIFIGLVSPTAMEIAATAGFDWLLIDGEHAPNNPVTVLPQLQAAAAYGVPVIVRPVNHDSALIKQYLGIGAQTLLVPMVETADEAAALVQAVRYPPHGIRGVGTALERSARWNAVEGYFKQADEEMCLIVQIESRAGLDNLDAILNVEGVDGVFIGPADLAASLGYLGQPMHPEVKTVIEATLKKIAAAGKAAGVFASDPATAKHYRSCGAAFVAVGADTSILRNAAVALAVSFKDSAAQQATAAGAAY